MTSVNVYGKNNARLNAERGQKMFRFWGDGSKEAMDLIKAIRVRNTENFNWSFIFILAVVFYVYWTEIRKKDTEVICAGLALYGVH